MNSIRQKVTTETVAAFLIFLFPIFGVSIKNWLSDIFVILVLVGLVARFYAFNYQTPLYIQEKILIGILISFFSVFLISSTLAGWNQEGIYAIGTEIRFLFIIPVYLLVRKIPDCGKHLLAGAVIGALVGGVQAIIDIYYFGYRLAGGAYGHLFIGPVTLLMISLIVPGMHVFKVKKYVLYIMVLSGLIGINAIVLSTARSAYLGVIVIGILTIIYYLRGRTTAIFITLFAIVLAVAYLGDGRINQRVNRGFTEVQSYLHRLEKYPGQPSKYTMGSIGKRLEMWRATKYFFSEAPWFGVGRFNYAVKINEYAKEGLVNKKIANTPHAHNVFFNMIDEKGIFGLITTLLILYYPLYVFIRTRNASRDSAFAGIVLITAITVFSLTEAAPFVKGNFVAIYLVFLSVFFSWHLREVNRVKSNRLRTT